MGNGLFSNLTFPKVDSSIPWENQSLSSYFVLYIYVLEPSQIAAHFWKKPITVHTQVVTNAGSLLCSFSCAISTQRWVSNSFKIEIAQFWAKYILSERKESKCEF